MTKMDHHHDDDDDDHNRIGSVLFSSVLSFIHSDGFID